MDFDSGADGKIRSDLPMGLCRAPMIVTSRDGTLRVCLSRHVNAQKEDLIQEVLECFRAMGATEEDIAADHSQLLTNEQYFAEWCQDMPLWHSGAFYAEFENETE